MAHREGPLRKEMPWDATGPWWSIRASGSIWNSRPADIWLSNQRKFQPTSVRWMISLCWPFRLPTIVNLQLCEMNSFIRPHQMCVWIEIPMFVCNQEIYGYQMDMYFGGQSTDYDAEELLDVQLKVMGNVIGFKFYWSNLIFVKSDHFPPMEVHPLLEGYVHYPARDKLGFDDIYVINLERRPERRRRVECIFRLMGVDFKLFNAVDGRYRSLRLLILIFSYSWNSLLPSISFWS